MEEKEKQEHIRFKTIMEVLGKPKEHVEKTIRDYVDKIDKDPDLSILNKIFSDAKEQGKMWSIFTEIEIVVKGIKKLVGFCFDYMPSSVEVTKPENLVLKNTDISNFLNDLQAKLHDVDMVAKTLRAENKFLKRNMGISFRNTIAVLLKIKKMTLEELSGFTGINKDELKQLLDSLIKEEKVKIEEDKYKLA